MEDVPTIQTTTIIFHVIVNQTNRTSNQMNNWFEGVFTMFGQKKSQCLETFESESTYPNLPLPKKSLVSEQMVRWRFSLKILLKDFEQIWKFHRHLQQIASRLEGSNWCLRKCMLTNSRNSETENSKNYSYDPPRYKFSRSIKERRERWGPFGTFILSE